MKLTIIVITLQETTVMPFKVKEIDKNDYEEHGAVSSTSGDA